MAKKIPEFLNYFFEDCLLWNRQFSYKSMFGWYWIYKNWKIFSIYANDVLYFKTWENNIEDYKNKGSKPFTYMKKWKEYSLKYFELPEDIIEREDELNLWIEKSLEVVK